MGSYGLCCPLWKIIMNKKLTLLYEVNVLTHNDKNCGRTGIFFTAYNVLKQLSKSPDFDIVLYVSGNNVRYIRKDPFLSRFKFIKIYLDPSRFKKNIVVHRNNMYQTSSILKKIILFLKILKNYLCYFLNLFSKHKKRNEALLQLIDVFLSPAFVPEDEIIQHKNILQFIILYDATPLLFPEFFPDLESHWYSKVVNSLNKDAYYFCISESTKRDFLTLFPGRLDKDKMITMPIASAQDFFPEHNAEKLSMAFSKYGINYKTGAKYLFSFCSLDPRKNLIFTIKCYITFIKKHKINDLCFYLGGVETTPFFDKLEDAVSGFNKYRDKIIFLGYVDDEDVNILYSNALFFAYISQYEGFGMPPLEAMRAGVPVITSNNSSLPEVVGDAAATIDYDSEEQCIKVFEDFYFNEDLRKSYIQKGLERAKLFSWERTAGIISNTILKTQGL
jgi:glycosyltransferase involved in cell wall biosynthesis